MLDEQKKFRRKIPHLLVEVVVCTGLERQPYDVRRPVHKLVQNLVSSPVHGRIDRFG